MLLHIYFKSMDKIFTEKIYITFKEKCYVYNTTITKDFNNTIIITQITFMLHKISKRRLLDILCNINVI